MNLNCKNDCLEENSDKCILYTGPTYDRFKVESGQYYDSVVVTLLNELNEHVSTKVDLKCIFKNDCESCEIKVEIPKAVQLIIDKICSLTASDILYNGEHYCIGDDSISSGAIHLLGRNFKYSVQPTVNGSIVNYDLNDVIKTLPANYTVGRINTVISGKKKRGKTIILDSDKKAVGATISNDRYPIKVDIDMRVSTPSGDVKMVKQLSIPSPQQGDYVAAMNVKDFGSETNNEMSLEKFNEQLAAQVCYNKTELDSLQNLDLVGCKNLPRFQGSIKDFAGVTYSQLCDILGRLNSLENVTLTTKSDCGTTTNTVSQAEAFNLLSSNTCTSDTCK